MGILHSLPPTCKLNSVALTGILYLSFLVVKKHKHSLNYNIHIHIRVASSRVACSLVACSPIAVMPVACSPLVRSRVPCFRW